VKEAVQEWLTPKVKEFYSNGIRKLVYNWTKRIKIQDIIAETKNMSKYCVIIFSKLIIKLPLILTYAVYFDKLLVNFSHHTRKNACLNLTHPKWAVILLASGTGSLYVETQDTDQWGEGTLVKTGMLAIY
jgi:hypothetical protein